MNMLEQTLEHYKVDRMDITELCALYNEPQRAYHNMNHIEMGLNIIRSIELDFDLGEPLLFAWCYHDAKRSEEESVDIARTHLIDRYPQHIDKISSLIMATKHDQYGKDFDEKCIQDIDLSILSSPWEVFKQYDDAIRKEYLLVPDELFYVKRKEILEKFLSRERMYQSDVFNKPDNTIRAKRNIRRLLADDKYRNVT